MSASTEKKLRQAAREAGTDKKTLALEKEAKEKAKRKRRVTLSAIGVFLLIALILFLNSNLLYRSTALTIGDEDYSASELSYYYGNQYYYWVNQYGSYASLFGLDTSAGIKGLDSQSCPMMEEGSWRDYFLQAAENDMLQEKALCDYAKANGIELTEDELAAVETSFEGMDEYAAAQGFANADKLFAANYGPGVNTALIRSAYQSTALASKGLEAYTDSLEYTQAEIDKQYESYAGDRDYFDYAYYYVAAETTEVEGEDGQTTSEVSPEALTAAEATAKAILQAYEAEEGEDAAARLDAAVAANVADASATHSTNTQGSSLGAYKEWLMDSGRKTGDVTVVENGSQSGYYVVVYIARENNDYNLAQVRHILIKAEADADGNYTDAAKAAAKARAEEILAEFEAGDKTEESFAALAEQYSEDAGSSANGGLYDSVIKGQMVQEFNDFCFAGHKAGDTGIVYGESGSYAGYHVMYYVGEGENYADSIARSDLVNTAVTEWLGELTAAYTTSTGFGLRLVG